MPHVRYFLEHGVLNGSLRKMSPLDSVVANSYGWQSWLASDAPAPGPSESSSRRERVLASEALPERKRGRRL